MELMNPLVTVVIPIYNVEKYLDRCVQSVVNQSYSNLEIILVDDGSTDGCYDLCDQWEKQDRRIRVIHKDNAGLGMARNTGIENANGTYICFFDSDDYIRQDALEKAIVSASTYNSDIVIWGWGGIGKSGELYTTYVPHVDKEFYQGIEVQEYFLPNLLSEDPQTGATLKLQMNAWSSLFSLALIKSINWRFVSEREIIAEDVYSLLDLYSEVQRVSVVQDYLYFYCVNESSLTQVYRADRYWKIKNFYLSSVALCKRKGYSGDVIERVKGPFLSFVIAALKQESQHKAFRNKNIHDIIHDKVLQDVMGTHVEKKNRKKYFLYWLMKRRYVSFCEILLYLQTRVKQI
jgi:glycosyltransferase involved in cell wall biosynthesis